MELDDGALTNLKNFNGVSTNLVIVNVASDTSLTAVVPVGVAPGTYNVQVTNSGGTNSTSAMKYTAVMPIGTIQGRITRACCSFAPISGAIVKAMQGLDIMGIATTDIDGNYSMSVFAGVYDVSASKGGYNSSTTSEITVIAEQITEINMALTVIPPTVVSVAPSSGYSNRNVTITVTGTGFFGGGASSDIVDVSLSDLSPVKQGKKLKTTVLTVLSVPSDTLLNAVVPAGVTPGTYNIRVINTGGTNVSSAVRYIAVPALGVISGTITKENGNTPIAGAKVEIKHGAVVKDTQFTDESGSYTSNSLPEGTYDVKASADTFNSNTVSGVIVTVAQTTTVNIALSYITEANADIQPGNSYTLTVYSRGRRISLSIPMNVFSETVNFDVKVVTVPPSEIGIIKTTIMGVVPSILVIFPAIVPKACNTSNF